jgi:hypothetical protein
MSDTRRYSLFKLCYMKIHLNLTQMCPEYVVIRVEFVCQLCTSNSSRWLCTLWRQVTLWRVWFPLSRLETKRQRGWSMAAGRTDILSEVGNLWHASVCLPNQRVTAHVTLTAICDVGYRLDTSPFYLRCVLRKCWCVMSCRMCHQVMSCRMCHQVIRCLFIWESLFLRCFSDDLEHLRDYLLSNGSVINE